MINISKTLSVRQQMRAASVFYNGMFEFEDFYIPADEVVYKKNLILNTKLNRELSQIMEDDDILVKSVKISSQSYKTGDLLAVRVTDVDSIDAGIVVAILVKSTDVYFICKMHSCTRNFLQYFESHSSDPNLSCINSKEIADYKPLVKRGSMDKFVFFLHHRIRKGL